MNTNTAIKTLSVALNEVFPVPNTPHTSVKLSNAESRIAFRFGWEARDAEIADLRTALEAAQQQLAAIEPPSFSRDPDGDLALDWRVGDAWLSVSFSQDGLVSWATNIAGKSDCGSQQVVQRGDGELPPLTMALYGTRELLEQEQQRRSALARRARSGEAVGQITTLTADRIGATVMIYDTSRVKVGDAIFTAPPAAVQPDSSAPTSVTPEMLLAWIDEAQNIAPSMGDPLALTPIQIGWIVGMAVRHTSQPVQPDSGRDAALEEATKICEDEAGNCKEMGNLDGEDAANRCASYIRDMQGDQAPAAKKPSTLAEQVKQAQAEYDSWTPEKRASVKLEGSSNYPEKKS